MATQNKKKLLFGFIFIIIAFGWIVGAFYYFIQKNPSNNDKMAVMEEEITKLKAQVKNSSQNSSITKESAAPFKLEILVKKAESIYSDPEKSRKEGFLWFDRATRSFIITLGALHGLHVGNQLSIYDGDKKIDIGSVDFPFDVVSYVKPFKNSPRIFHQ